MVNILQFPGSGKASDTGFAQDADLEALFADDTSMVFSADSAMPVLKFRSPVSSGTSGDWTNQELADLYRVEALLVQAGVKLDTARGVTDENDPWFVFCRPDGEVFVHLARIDGQYLLDSPGMGTPVYGDDFTSLIDIFVKQQVEKAPSGNVVRFRPGAGRDGTVRLHPAMMLAALIWTLYMACDAFIGTAEAAEHNDGSHGSGHDAAASAIAWRTSAPASGQNGTDNAAGQGVNSRDELSAKAASFEARSSHPGFNHTSGSIAASLAAIAVSWGLYDPRNSIALEPASVSSTATAQQQASAAHVEQQDATASAAHDAASAEVVHHGRDEKHATVSAPAEKVHQHVTTELAATDDRHTAPVVTVEGPQQVQAVAAAEQQAMTVAKHTQVDNASQAETVAVAAKPAELTEMQSILKLAALYIGDSTTYKVGSISVAATFDISSLGETATEIVFSGIVTPDVVVQPPAITDNGSGTVNTSPASNTASTASNIAKQNYIPSYVAAYDQAAKDFVYKFLMETSATLEMIKIDKSVIFVDTSAIDEPGIDVTSVRSWVLDGNTVSMIGHAADFAKYDIFT